MIIKIYNKKYRLDPIIAASTKKIINNILNQVKENAKEKGLKHYYVSFVVMMYIISSTILKEIRTDEITKIAREIEYDD